MLEKKFRPGYGQFRVEDIDANLCTHGFYGFADLHNDTWTLKIWDPWLDQAPNDPNCNNGEFCDYDNYRKFIALKNVNPDFVPMISIGKLNKNKQKNIFHKCALWIINDVPVKDPLELFSRF